MKTQNCADITLVDVINLMKMAGMEFAHLNQNVSIISEQDIESELKKNAYLEDELKRFSVGFSQINSSKIGRVALKLERIFSKIPLSSRRLHLRDACIISIMPVAERSRFANCVLNNMSLRDKPKYLSVRYAQFLEEGISSGIDLVNDDVIYKIEKINAKLYQDVLNSQAVIGKSLGGFRGAILRVLDSLSSVVRAGSLEKSYLLRLWSGYNTFRHYHNADLKALHSNRFNRLKYLFQVLRYALANPYASIRTFTWHRFIRLAKVLLGIDKLNTGAWIEQRFPLDSTSAEKPIIFAVDESTAQCLELEFPQTVQPLVSIIVPVYNQYATTISCLQSLLAHSEGTDYEVIIADDRSSDLTVSIASRIKNVRVVRNEVNLGFLKNCNNAAKFARGKYVLLLNNDTNPQPGWLKSLLDVFSKQEKVGLVGPKLLFEDGVLQEAGGIIWRDASGWNFGRGQSPDAPEYNYLKDVDYISGACVMLEKSLWDDLGGFDELFCPAYYEDTDLAFQIRARGLRTVYQPASSVVHFEGVSHGSDINSGIKKQQRINQGVFRDKWKQVLDSENHHVGVDVFNARERAASQKTVLFIDHYVPFYDKDAGSRSTFLYVKTMVEMGYRIKFLGANFFPHQPYTETLQQLGVEVLYGERFARNWKLWLEENAEYLDVIYLHRPHITEDFISEIKSLKKCPRLVYFGHDLHCLRTEREANISDDKKLLKAAGEWKEREYRIFQQVDTVLYPSDVEVKAVKEFSPKTNVAQLPLYVLDTPDVANFDFSARKDLLFVGGFTHTPNVDAVLWFASEVLGKVIEVHPDIRLHVVGSNVPEAISSLASDKIIVHGFVSDAELDSLYRSIRVCVVPLRYGAGVKGKVLEALQAAVPLITTPIGAEGIPEAASVMEIAEAAEDFASSLIEMYGNEQKCLQQLAGRADFVSEHFSLGVVRSAIEDHILG
ncbi:glycosyltransferase [Microbulbifer mangrovi]|uniref:glycosyltransferase n=1 Tax=Microbulbifer mangrovi TaxID=927787 RepID=UPI001180CE7E|nr:glycosyltransferase [Microbulbifer mangrovi]